jgi:hypothetical protein
MNFAVEDLLYQQINILYFAEYESLKHTEALSGMENLESS